MSGDGLALTAHVIIIIIIITQGYTHNNKTNYIRLRNSDQGRITSAPTVPLKLAPNQLHEINFRHKIREYTNSNIVLYLQHSLFNHNCMAVNNKIAIGTIDILCTEQYNRSTNFHKYLT